MNHTDNIWLVAGVWMALAAVSAFVAVRIKMPAALVEIVVGMLAGNLIALRTNAWIDFVAGIRQHTADVFSRRRDRPNRSSQTARTVDRSRRRIVCSAVPCGDGVCVFRGPLDAQRREDRGHRDVDDFGGGGLRRDGRIGIGDQRVRTADSRGVLFYRPRDGRRAGVAVRKLRSLASSRWSLPSSPR